MKVALALTALLAACTQQPAQPPTKIAAAAARAVGPLPAAKAFTHKEGTDLIELEFNWPAEAAAIPELVARFRKQLKSTKSDLIGAAEGNKQYREEAGEPMGVPFQSVVKYETAGQSPRLLSLSVYMYEYTGGAHGNFGTGGLLWDRAAKKEIQVADLFAQPANRDRLLTQRWCDEINKAREEKRGEPVSGNGMFNDCPSLDEIEIVPTDENKNGRLERLVLIAGPYVAGPYSEGQYEIELPVTPELIAALKADYRDSFEIGQPQ